jgi:hypothetical protein
MYYRVDNVTGEPVNVEAYRSGSGYVVVREWVAVTIERTAFHAVSLTDTSSEWPVGTGYDSACGWCWLNAPHTADAHSVATRPGA